MSPRAADQPDTSSLIEVLGLLTEVDDTLVGCTTRGEVMTRIPALISTTLADWCGLFVRPRSGPPFSAPDMESAASDESLDAALRRRYGPEAWDPDATSGLAQVLRTGRAERIWTGEPGSGPDGATAGADGPEAHGSLLVAITEPDRPIGALHLVRAGDAQDFTDSDVVVVGRIAHRVAETLTRLATREEERDLVITFQQALLPAAIPEIDGLDVAVRYRPGGRHNEVGGDFYDLLGLDGDRWLLVIGDVSGHGPTAAAVTALAHHSIRMSAWHGDGPATILGWLDHALDAARSQPCTAAVSVLTRITQVGFELATALGGHPRPILCRADGTVRGFGTWGTLLGSVDHPRATTTTTLLRPGDAVVFYTDGITELPPPLGLTEEQLAGLIAERRRPGDGADRLLDGLLAVLQTWAGPELTDDDVALMAVQVT